MYVCLCTGMNCRQLKQAVADGARTPAQLFRHHGSRPGCGRCRETMLEMLDEAAALRDATQDPGDLALPPLGAGLAAAAE